ncbi:MAG TPA: hypothetical protein VFK57_13270 [Vicinamibacterales bacterium]|nr:hypothetical protein [Vicinamibacterales bacterium]
MSLQPPSPRSDWEAFIDVLDLAGQAGNIAGVTLPAIAGTSAGKRFDELTSLEVKELSRLASSQGCRGEILAVMWRDLQWKVKQQKKLDQKRSGGARRSFGR